MAVGPATITVTATDTGDSDCHSRTIAVTVTAANSAPMKVGTIADMSVMTADTPDAMDVATYFSDADMDTLTYGVTSSDMKVATVSVAGSMVTITPMAAGETTITVTATDAAGSNKSAEQSFKVTVSWTVTAPQNVIRDPVGSGIVRVDWDAVPGADGYYVIAVAPGNAADYETATLAYPPGATLRVAVDDLTPGQVYNVFVVAFGASGSALSEIKSVTAE